MTQIEDSPSRSGKSQLILLVGIALLATVVPYVMYYTGLGVPTATTNQGVLVEEPIVMTDFHFSNGDGQPWILAEQTPKFRILIPVVGKCNATCEETLYLTRQVRRRLAEKSDQLDRIYVQLGQPENAELQEFLAAEHSDLIYLAGDLDQWQSEISRRSELQSTFDGTEYYLLHRYGALGLAYNNEHSGNQLLDDLEFLIRTSN